MLWGYSLLLVQIYWHRNCRLFISFSIPGSTRLSLEITLYCKPSKLFQCRYITMSPSFSSIMNDCALFLTILHMASLLRLSKKLRCLRQMSIDKHQFLRWCYCRTCIFPRSKHYSSIGYDGRNKNNFLDDINPEKVAVLSATTTNMSTLFFQKQLICR